MSEVRPMTENEAAMMQQIIDLRAEIARLTVCLSKANNNHEEFERKYYLGLDAKEKAEADLAAAQNALQRIARWHGEFPPVTLNDGTPSSYWGAYGSNGERDYMRGVAQAAIDAAQKEGNEAS